MQVIVQNTSLIIIIIIIIIIINKHFIQTWQKLWYPSYFEAIFIKHNSDYRNKVHNNDNNNTKNEVNALFKDTLNIFYLLFYGIRYMVKDQTARKEAHCHHYMGYSFW